MRRAQRKRTSFRRQRRNVRRLVVDTWDMTLVTVVIPTRDRLQYAHAAVATALAQEEVPVQVIVVDDGSSEPVVPALADDPRVRVVRHETSRGVAGARNAGIDAATGEWIAFLDDDDLWHPRKLRDQLDAAARADADWVFGGALVVDDAGAEIAHMPAPDDAAGLLDALLVENPVPAGASNVLARATVVRELGRFDEDLAHFADWLLWIRLAARGAPAVVTHPVLAYVHHGANMHADAAISGRAELPLLAARVLAATGLVVDTGGMETWMAYGEHVSGRNWSAAGVAARGALRRRSLPLARQAVGMVGHGLGLRGRGRRVMAPEWARPKG